MPGVISVDYRKNTFCRAHRLGTKPWEEHCAPQGPCKVVHRRLCIGTSWVSRACEGVPCSDRKTQNRGYVKIHAFVFFSKSGSQGA